MSGAVAESAEVLPVRGRVDYRYRQLLRRKQIARTHQKIAAQRFHRPILRQLQAAIAAGKKNYRGLCVFSLQQQEALRNARA